jgi:acetylornithine deacetylase/succinyl-diaminopimelate desuccinylase-like protein
MAETPGSLSAVLDDIRQSRGRLLDELVSLCRTESVSATGASLTPTAEAVAGLLRGAGVEVSMIQSARGRPIVVGRARGRSDRMIVFYNHYDVQPPDPLMEWISPPFDPTLRDGRLFARGVADDKGNLLARIQAVAAWNRVGGGLPVSVAFVAEGEEEIGSPHLEEFVKTNANWLSTAEGVVWESGYRDAAGRPTVTLGVKGICYLELIARGARTDTHSSQATLVPNPAWRLVWALSTIKDKDEHILVDDFYDAVRAPSQVDLELLRKIPDTSAVMAKNLGLPGLLLGLKGYDAQRRNFYEPTATICGLGSGYTGEGEKTVLPSRAMAKLDFRLVPDQEPEEIAALVKAHLRRQGFGDIEVKLHAGERPARTDSRSPFVGIVTDAVEKTYDQPAVIHPTMTGSGPMPVFTDLGLPVVGFGVGNPMSASHAPNENVIMEDYWLGVEMVATLLHRAAGKWDGR